MQHQVFQLYISRLNPCNMLNASTSDHHHTPQHPSAISRPNFSRLFTDLSLFILPSMAHRISASPSETPQRTAQPKGPLTRTQNGGRRPSATALCGCRARPSPPVEVVIRASRVAAGGARPSFCGYSKQGSRVFRVRELQW